jgi:hypothetical protein
MKTRFKVGDIVIDGRGKRGEVTQITTSGLQTHELFLSVRVKFFDDSQYITYHHNGEFWANGKKSFRDITLDIDYIIDQQWSKLSRKKHKD